MEDFSMFGKTYKTFGSLESNLLLRTKGDIKIQIGNKFVDLSKYTKAGGSESIKVVSNSEDVKNTGIFIVQNDSETSLWINGIKFSDKIDGVYVSYNIQKDITEEQRNNALKNLGIYFDNLQDLYDSNITSGIFYVKDQNTQYIYKNGQYVPYTFQNNQIDLLWYEGN